MREKLNLLYPLLPGNQLGVAFPSISEEIREFSPVLQVPKFWQQCLTLVTSGPSPYTHLLLLVICVLLSYFGLLNHTHTFENSPSLNSL